MPSQISLRVNGPRKAGPATEPPLLSCIQPGSQAVGRKADHHSIIIWRNWHAQPGFLLFSWRSHLESHVTKHVITWSIHGWQRNQDNDATIRRSAQQAEDRRSMTSNEQVSQEGGQKFSLQVFQMKATWITSASLVELTTSIQNDMLFVSHTVLYSSECLHLQVIFVIWFIIENVHLLNC